MDASLVRADAVPPRLGLHEEVDASTSEYLRERRCVRHRDLEVDPSAQRALKWSGDPVATHSRLFQHQVRRTERDVREAFFRARVGDAEAAQVAPELDAPVQVGHEQLGNERGFEGLRHQPIITVLTLRVVPGADRPSTRPVLCRRGRSTALIRGC